MAFNVLSAEFLHESNTFNIHKTGLAAFEAQIFVTDSAGIAALAGTNTGVAGCLECAEDYGWTLTHAVSAHAGPSGPVTTGAFDRVSGLILDAAQTSKPDGVLLPLHGAMVTEFCDDGEGELLERLRGVIGPDIPVAITLDLHANVTVRMCQLADIIVSYKTYPHIDMRDAACHAGAILQRTMQGEISPRTIRVQPPMLIEPNSGRTDIGPMVARIAKARAYEKEPDVFAVSINAGFEHADIAEIGPTVLVTCQGDETQHRQFAEEIAADMWQYRADVLNTFHNVEQAADIAAEFADSGTHKSGPPLIIADYADNPGGGAYGDSTALLDALLTKETPNTCFGPMVDPEAARRLHQHHVGDSVTLDLGGKTDPKIGGGPLNLSGQIRYLGDGICIGDGPMKGGVTLNFGASAVLHVDGMDILIVSLPLQMYDQQQFQTFGIDPAAKTVVAVKSMQHFRAAFEPIAARIIVCDSGALCTPDLTKLPYKNVRRPIYPLDDIA